MAYIIRIYDVIYIGIQTIHAVYISVKGLVIAVIYLIVFVLFGYL